MGDRAHLLRRLTPEDVGPSAEVMSDCFEDDPYWQHLMGDKGARDRALSRFYHTVSKVIIKNGEMYGIGEPLRGIAWWVTPGSRRWSVLSKLGYLELAFGRFLPYICPLLSTYKELDEHRERLVAGPHYYLKLVAVSSRLRGKGLASQLIRPFLTTADERRLPVYLETLMPSNVGIYQHYGFEVAEISQLKGTGIKVWCMLRPPGPKG